MEGDSHTLLFSCSAFLWVLQVFVYLLPLRVATLATAITLPGASAHAVPLLHAHMDTGGHT